MNESCNILKSFPSEEDSALFFVCPALLLWTHLKRTGSATCIKADLQHRVPLLKNGYEAGFNNNMCIRFLVPSCASMESDVMWLVGANRLTLVYVVVSFMLKYQGCIVPFHSLSLQHEVVVHYWLAALKYGTPPVSRIVRVCRALYKWAELVGVRWTSDLQGREASVWHCPRCLWFFLLWLDADTRYTISWQSRCSEDVISVVLCSKTVFLSSNTPNQFTT